MVLIVAQHLVVTYQDWRGEGRAPLRKDRTWDARKLTGLGDCIDCRACVHVCPTGIDIREGFQMDCISCGLCIDACDDVMVRIDRSGGLIRYDTQVAQAAKAASHASEPYRLVRPRTIVYTLLLVIVTGIMAMGLAMKPSVDVAVLRDRAPLFVTLSDGSIQNSYTLKISNMSRQTEAYRLTVSGIDGATVTRPGADALADGELELSAGCCAVLPHPRPVSGRSRRRPIHPIELHSDRNVRRQHPANRHGVPGSLSPAKIGRQPCRLYVMLNAVNTYIMPRWRYIQSGA
jgi:cytochrome c oxidase accessory protein FixG